MTGARDRFRPQTQLEWYRCAARQRYTERGCAGALVRLAWSEVERFIWAKRWKNQGILAGANGQ